MDQNLLFNAIDAARSNQKSAFATIIKSTAKGTPQKTGAKMLVLEDGTIFGTIGGGRNEKSAQAECIKAIKSGKTKTVKYDFFGGKDKSVCGGQIEVFIEPLKGSKELIICGGGHIGLPLSVYATILNYEVTVLDNRREFASKKRFPHVKKVVCCEHKKFLSKANIGANTHIMIVTQGNEHDYQCLKSVIKSDAAYIGVISSKAKKIKFVNRLKKEKIPEKHIKKIKIPAGIDIGAQTPQEIAISISAELVRINNLENLNSAKFTNKSIKESS